MPASLETLFHTSTLHLVVPPTASFDPLPESGSDSAGGESSVGEARAEWCEAVGRLETRETAFLDERLSYAVTLTVPDSGSADIGSESAPIEVKALVSRLQLTATAAFLPPVPRRSVTADSTPSASKRGSLAHSGHESINSTGEPAEPSTPTPRNADVRFLAAAAAGATTPTEELGTNGIPMTPTPFPSTASEDEDYANVQGVTVWEGPVETPENDSKPVVLVKTHAGWAAVWRGELPVLYVRTQIANPVVGITASATLREGPSKRSRMSTAPDSASINTMTTLEDEYDVEDSEEIDLAELEEVDLLGGLGGEDTVPGTRMGQTLRDDMSIGLHLVQGTPMATVPHLWPIPPSTTLRKSFRRVLSLSPGLRVRMRTLFLPQLLSPTDSVDGSEDAERRIVLSVEIENGADAQEHNFEVENVSVEIGGKGAKATAELICQPGQDLRPPTAVFPLRLNALEQYNLLYVVTIASSPSGPGSTEPPRNRGEDQRPVSIVVTGRPYSAAGQYPTSNFDSRWNCGLDLGPFYASLPPAPPAPQQAHAPRPPSNRFSKPVPPTPNVIAGDKRYTLSALMSNEPKPGMERSRLVSNPPRPNLPSQMHPGMNNRMASYRQPLGAGHPQSDGHGLLVSVKLLPTNASANAYALPGQDLDGPTNIRPLDTFSIEVFVHNRTDAVRRFRLSIPTRDTLESRVRELWGRRRRRRPEEAAYGADDAVLAALLGQYDAAAPPLVALENDVRCGPLLPGASLAARIRFLALRAGVHRIDRLRITGSGDEFDFVISPVLEVVVGKN